MNVGIDHGYYAIKTRHFSFLAGIAVYSHEPYTLQNTLEYGVPNYSLKEWNEAVSYLLGCEVNFKDYGEIEKSLKPFSLEVK